MLNISNPILDQNLFTESYAAIKSNNEVEIINGQEKEVIFQQTLQSIRTPNETKNFWFENLFKINVNHVSFYIAQCVIDFGFVPSTMGFPTSTQTHTVQILGIAKSKFDLGNTSIRPEGKVEKFMAHFYNLDIDLHDKYFNDRYFVKSDKEEEIKTVFNQSFLDTFAKFNNILFTANGYDLYISFTSPMTAQQGLAIIDIFKSGTFLST